MGTRVELVREGYRYFNEENAPKLWELFEDDVEFTDPIQG